MLQNGIVVANLAGQPCLATWKLKINQHHAMLSHKVVRGWKCVNRQDFREALKRSILCDETLEEVTTEHLFESYDSVLRELADRFALERSMRFRRQNIAVWYNDESRRLRRQSRALERQYRRTRLPADRPQWVQQKERHRINGIKENTNRLTCSSTHSGQPRELWKHFSQIMGLDTAGTLPVGDPTSQDLMDYFVKKIETIRNSTVSPAAASTRLPPATAAAIYSFRIYDLEEVRRIITSTPSKSCSLDRIPTVILKEFLPELLPCITELCNRSLS